MVNIFDNNSNGHNQLHDPNFKAYHALHDYISKGHSKLHECNLYCRSQLHDYNHNSHRQLHCLLTPMVLIRYIYIIQSPTVIVSYRTLPHNGHLQFHGLNLNDHHQLLHLLPTDYHQQDIWFPPVIVRHCITSHWLLSVRYLIPNSHRQALYYFSLIIIGKIFDSQQSSSGTVLLLTDYHQQDIWFPAVIVRHCITSHW
jgi:hypothetical protein